MRLIKLKLAINRVNTNVPYVGARRRIETIMLSYFLQKKLYVANICDNSPTLQEFKEDAGLPMNKTGFDFGIKSENNYFHAILREYANGNLDNITSREFDNVRDHLSKIGIFCIRYRSIGNQQFLFLPNFRIYRDNLEKIRRNIRVMQKKYA